MSVMGDLREQGRMRQGYDGKVQVSGRDFGNTDLEEDCDEREEEGTVKVGCDCR